MELFSTFNKMVDKKQLAHLTRATSILRYLKSVGDIRSIVAVFERSRDISAATCPRNSI